jgi:hypothetical protein
MADAHSTAEAHGHPTPGTYAKIGLVLFVLTALEVGLYEGTYGDDAGSLGYMHLRDDSRLFSGVFVFPITIAAVIILGLIALQAYHWAFAASP